MNYEPTTNWMKRAMRQMLDVTERDVTATHQEQSCWRLLARCSQLLDDSLIQHADIALGEKDCIEITFNTHAQVQGCVVIRKIWTSQPRYSAKCGRQLGRSSCADWVSTWLLQALKTAQQERLESALQTHIAFKKKGLQR